jgi:hypothetical protein
MRRNARVKQVVEKSPHGTSRKEVKRRERKRREKNSREKKRKKRNEGENRF